MMSIRDLLNWLAEDYRLHRTAMQLLVCIHRLLPFLITGRNEKRRLCMSLFAKLMRFMLKYILTILLVVTYCEKDIIYGYFSFQSMNSTSSIFSYLRRYAAVSILIRLDNTIETSSNNFTYWYLLQILTRRYYPVTEFGMYFVKIR